MPNYLLDSCVLIRQLRNYPPTVRLMESLVLDGNLSIATITRTEIVEGMRDHEREKTMRLLNSLPAHPLDSAVADLAGEYIRRFRQRGTVLDKPDAIIAATAVHHDLLLVTYNPSHFPMPELDRYPVVLA